MNKKLLQKTTARMMELQIARFLALGNDERFARVNAGRVVEMVVEDYVKDLRTQPQYADQLLVEYLEDMEKACAG